MEPHQYPANGKTDPVHEIRVPSGSQECNIPHSCLPLPIGEPLEGLRDTSLVWGQAQQRNGVQRRQQVREPEGVRELRPEIDRLSARVFVPFEEARCQVLSRDSRLHPCPVFTVSGEGPEHTAGGHVRRLCGEVGL